MFLTRISVNHPVFATMIMVAMLVFGIYSYQRLPIEQLPDIDLPVVAVVVSYPGASPEAVENDIVKPIEEAVNTIAGLDTIQSTSQAGQAMVIILFDMEVNSQTAAQDVRDRLATVEADLPENAGDPQVLRFDPGRIAGDVARGQFRHHVAARPDGADRRRHRHAPLQYRGRGPRHRGGRRAAPAQRPDRSRPAQCLQCRRRRGGRGVAAGEPEPAGRLDHPGRAGAVDPGRRPDRGCRAISSISWWRARAGNRSIWAMSPPSRTARRMSPAWHCSMASGRWPSTWSRPRAPIRWASPQSVRQAIAELTGGGIARERAPGDRARQCRAGGAVVPGGAEHADRRRGRWPWSSSSCSSIPGARPSSPG